MTTALWELPGDACRDGVLPLPEAEPFDRVVVSLNHGAWAPEAGARVGLRARIDGAWTPWAPLGVYGAGPDLPRSEVGTDSAQIEVQVDTICLPRPATRAEVRLELKPGRSAAAVQRLAVLAWRRGTGSDDARARHAAWGRALDVPERSQQVEAEDVRHRICSPTSLSMVLAFHGAALPTARVAEGVYDHAAKIYGNWSFNVAFASTRGFAATVARCETFVPVEDEVAAGRPVVISHRYAKGEVEGAAVSETDGHLIVVRGFTDDGDLVVNDPAADPRQGKPIRRVYRRADLAKSWLKNGSGICYLVRRA